MAAATKLTKKQKKALAFRERKGGKGGKDAASNDMEGNELPEMEIQDIVDEQGDEVEDENVDEKKEEEVPRSKKAKGKEKEKERGEEDSVAPQKSKKRKRENEGDVETKAEDSKTPKRRKTEGDRERLILFLGSYISVIGEGLEFTGLHSRKSEIHHISRVDNIALQRLW